MAMAANGGGYDTPQQTTKITMKEIPFLQHLSPVSLSSSGDSKGSAPEPQKNIRVIANSSKNQSQMLLQKHRQGKNDPDETNTSLSGEVIGTNTGAPTKENLIKNDVLLLKIPLKLNEKEQHVQFDFHLIEDDPIQVAKEMVRELAFPEDAILGISERISAMARRARMEKTEYREKLSFQQSQKPEEISELTTEQSIEQVGTSPDKITPTPSANAPTSQNEENIKTTGTIVPGTRTTSTVQLNPKPIPDETTSINDNKSSLFESEVDEALIKQAKIEHENKVKRTMKAFQTRIDNIQRSKEEKEAQYLKMIEKYEKEKAAVEKRMLQTEKEQQDRLQQLEEEWKLEKAKIIETNQNSMKGLDNDKPPLIPIGSDDKLKQSEHASNVSLLSMASANGEKVGVGGEHLSSSSPTVSLEDCS